MNTSKINFRKLRNKTTEKQFNFNNVQKHNIKRRGLQRRLTTITTSAATT